MAVQASSSRSKLSQYNSSWSCVLKFISLQQGHVPALYATSKLSAPSLNSPKSKAYSADAPSPRTCGRVATEARDRPGTRQARPRARGHVSAPAVARAGTSCFAENPATARRSSFCCCRLRPRCFERWPLQAGSPGNPRSSESPAPPAPPAARPPRPRPLSCSR